MRAPGFIWNPPPPWCNFTNELDALLGEVECLFGPAADTRKLRAVYADGSLVTEVKYKGEDIRIHVGQWNPNDRPQAYFQLTHEVFHVLSQSDEKEGVPATRLEEGLAVYFQMKMTWSRHPEANIGHVPGSRLDHAFLVAKQLLACEPNVIVAIRKDTQPVVSRITKEDILAVCPVFPLGLAEWLCRDFYSGDGVPPCR